MTYLLTYLLTNPRLVDSIEEIGRTDANIDWSSDEDLDWLTNIKAAFELLRTLFLLKFFEIYSKCFELYNYDHILGPL